MSINFKFLAVEIIDHGSIGKRAKTWRVLLFLNRIKTQRNIFREFDKCKSC